jgi:uncharacterized protein (DUF2267 family)
MQYDEFIRKVQEDAGIKEKEEAVRVVFAVLGTLGEKIYRTEERQMSAQLPKELKNAFYQYQPVERGRADLGNYTLEEFYNRVKARAGVSFFEAQRLTKIVICVLKEAVSAGEVEDVVRELPENFRVLFA